ncbi:rhodanese-related sulfurtransferase [Mycetocola sp. BIGb0189]|uniref:rhodanese-like domain-containing protein n=1 Tax=Mycetocola sp. BIGb0189 TaxID=2940604 RepID=UPI002167C9D3|nr:rhodanese-like domain-containing protein [Mycetocola sp. BIGb0189]MCS4277223.1 rhodanese-related sulfurtransferase [Mycetocola sp. BIGb0189]
MQEITVTELAALNPGVALIDVREPEEHAGGVAPEATLLPMSTFMEREAELPEAETLYLICAGGVRSARVGAYLEQKGLNVVNVEGGMNAWAQAGLPIVAPGV